MSEIEKRGGTLPSPLDRPGRGGTEGGVGGVGGWDGPILDSSMARSIILTMYMWSYEHEEGTEAHKREIA